jgi:hypothetical protein
MYSYNRPNRNLASKKDGMMQHTKLVKQEKGFEKDFFILVGRGRVNIKMDVYGSSKYVANFKKTPQQHSNSLRILFRTTQGQTWIMLKHARKNYFVPSR